MTVTRTDGMYTLGCVMCVIQGECATLDRMHVRCVWTIHHTVRFSVFRLRALVGTRTRNWGMHIHPSPQKAEPRFLGFGSMFVNMRVY
jgi:hypothetical protein